MKLTFSLLFLITLIACNKKGDDKCDYPVVTISASNSERQQVQAYLSLKGITATLHPNGFYYNVLNAGTGNKAVACSIVSVQYTARLANDSIFDATPGGAFYTDRVGTFLPGLQLGMGLIGKSGSIQLFLPSSLGFGSSPYPNPINPVVPANSILIYDVTISDLK